MSSPAFLLHLLFFAFAFHILSTLAQCNDPSFVPCPPNDSSGTSGGNVAGSGGATIPSSGGIGEGIVSPAGSAPVEGAAIDGIQGGDDDDGGGGFRFRREALFCCRPSPVQCVELDDGLPACYNPDTTRYFFPDGSYYFASNDTFYYANGTSTMISAASGTVAASTAGPTASAVIPGESLGSTTTGIMTAASEKATNTASSTERSMSSSPAAKATAIAKPSPSAAKSEAATKNLCIWLAGIWASMLGVFLFL